jgi:hypothetical protein
MIKIIALNIVFWISFFGFTQIRIDNPVYDFGNIFETKGKVKITFNLVNPYIADTIQLVNIETSCGCTAILSKDTIIYPQSTINLEVEYDPKGRTGLFEKSIKIVSLTGQSEKNTLYLKIKGNVISEHIETVKNTELIDYKVSPIYFYPITQYDTSYLDYNFITDFVNDLTYEIDYYKFSRVGFTVSIRNKTVLSDLEYLLRFVRHKLIRLLNRGGYNKNNIFYALPIFQIANDYPKWAFAELKVFSVSFNDDTVEKSLIRTTKNLKEKKDTIDYTVNVKSTEPLIVDSVLSQVNFNKLNQYLLKNDVLVLNVNLKVPESASAKQAQNFKKKVNKQIYTSLKKSIGVKKKNLVLNYQEPLMHASTRYYFQMWLDEDVKKTNVVDYKVKKDKIIQPLLPTYKQQLLSEEGQIDTNSIQFQHFWSALLMYHQMNPNFKVIVEASTSRLKRKIETDQLYFARQKSAKAKKLLEKMFFVQTNDTLNIEIRNVLLGPEYNKKEFKTEDYLQYEYIKLVPVFNQKRELPIKTLYPIPYIVNYDYFFNGVDTTSIIFKKFASYLIYDIQTYGYVEVKTESSTSNIPTDKHKSTQFVAYKHIYESKKRIFKYLKNRLIDPNRFLISEERILVQGIPYNRKTPVVRYKRYQYVTFVPAKYLE